MNQKILILVLLLWIGCHLIAFAGYHALLRIPFTPWTALFIVLFCLFFALPILFFKSRVLTAFVALLYGLLLLWFLCNFEYFRVFQTFLQFPLTRAASVNGTMLVFLMDFLPEIPRAVLALLGSLFLSSVFLSMVVHAFHHRSAAMRLSLTGDRVLSMPLRTSGMRQVSTCIAFQTSVLALFVGSLLGYHVKIAHAEASPVAMLGDLGVIAYPLMGIFRAAADEGEEIVTPTDVADAANEEPAASPRKTTMQLLREDLSSLARPRGTISTKPILVKKPHIIIYQLESVADWPVRQQPSAMPFLQSLMNSSGHVDSYFSNGCTTIDAEFAINCGFLPDAFGPVSDLYEKNEYRCLPAILKEQGYKTFFHHAGETSFWSRDSLIPSWGYDQMDFSPAIPYRAADQFVIDRVLRDMASSTEPELHYITGITTHAPHNKHFKDYYNRAYGLNITPYEEPLPADEIAGTEEDSVRQYMGFLRAADNGIAELFDKLASTGLARNTIVVIFGDHRYYNFTSPDPIKAYENYNRIPFVLSVPGMGGVTLARVGSHLDVPETLYDLVGDPNMPLPPSFLGTSLFSPSHPEVAISKCLGEVSTYDGSTLIKGNALLDRYQSSTVAAHADDAQSRIETLKRVVRRSDALLKHNLIGVPSLRTTVRVAGTVEMDAVTDRDQDGISDMREMAMGTNPEDPDTDGDGYPDGIEVTNGYSPLGPGKATSTEEF